MKELNYDEVLAPPKLKITIGGKKYEVPQPSLQQIFDYEGRAKELRETCAEGASGAECGEKWIKLITSIFTCIPSDVLKEKNFPLLRTIAGDSIRFMQESMYADAPEDEKEDKKKEK